MSPLIHHPATLPHTILHFRCQNTLGLVADRQFIGYLHAYFKAFSSKSEAENCSLTTVTVMLIKLS